MKNEIGETILNQFDEESSSEFSFMGLDDLKNVYQNRIKHSGMQNEAVNFYLEQIQIIADSRLQI